jgi:hypothetical protein
MNRSVVYGIMYLAVTATMVTASWVTAEERTPRVVSFGIAKGNPPLSTHYYAISRAVNADAVRVVQSLEEYLPQAQAIYRNAVPTGETKAIQGVNYSTIKANAYKMAYLDPMVLGDADYIPAAGLPGVKTYVQVSAIKEKPLRIAENLVISQGEFFFDGEVFLLLVGSSYIVGK